MLTYILVHGSLGMGIPFVYKAMMDALWTIIYTTSFSAAPDKLINNHLTAKMSRP